MAAPAIRSGSPPFRNPRVPGGASGHGCGALSERCVTSVDPVRVTAPEGGLRSFRAEGIRGTETRAWLRVLLRRAVGHDLAAGGFYGRGRSNARNSLTRRTPRRRSPRRPRRLSAKNRRDAARPTIRDSAGQFRRRYVFGKAVTRGRRVWVIVVEASAVQVLRQPLEDGSFWRRSHDRPAARSLLRHRRRSFQLALQHRDRRFLW